MTVKDLVAALKLMPQNAPVMVYNHDGSEWEWAGLPQLAIVQEAYDGSAYFHTIDSHYAGDTDSQKIQAVLI